MTQDALISLLEKMGLQNVTLRNGNVFANCPYHQESRPSWGISVSPPHVFGCFSCKVGGTLERLLIDKGGLTPEQAAKVAGRAHAAKALKFQSFFSELSLVEQKENEMPLLDDRVLWLYARSVKAVKYMRQRGVSFSVIRQANILHDSHQDRVLFPWRMGGCLRGLTGRTLNDHVTKVLPYFGTPKGQLLYLPLGKIWAEPLIIVEGEIDALKIASAGFRNVAALGFGSFTDTQATLALNSAATSFVLFFDLDAAGELLRKKARKKLLPRRIYCASYSKVQGRYADASKADPGMLSYKDIRRCIEGASSENWISF